MGLSQKWICQSILLIACFFSGTFSSSGYSLLSHEQMVDTLWKDKIQPLLLKRFPKATEEELRRAHAQAYGGCLIQDIGYYPFGSKFFSDLTHYVRTGDFVRNLILESTNLYEYAFALGALAHYSADVSAHPAINRAVALTFPKLRAKFGDSVTYADDPLAHVRVEFGFDVTQVAKNRYTSDQYHDFIGFEISKGVLDRAFFRTYGLKASEVLKNEDMAIETFRHAASRVVPQLTRAALTTRRAELVEEDPDFNEKKFLYNLSRSNYEKEWGKGYHKPGFFTRALGFFVLAFSKIGVGKSADFMIPTTETEKLYFQSFNQTVEDYQNLLQKIGRNDFRLPNVDFDTGKRPSAGEYALGDETYARLLNEHAKKGFRMLDTELHDDILAFYAKSQPSLATRKERKAWQKAQAQLELLRQPQRLTASDR